jgi:beta-glucosidase
MKAESASSWLPLDACGIVLILVLALCTKTTAQPQPAFRPFRPPISFEEADRRADSVLATLSLEEKVAMIGGENSFFIKGFENHHIPQLYLSDATQGVHLRKELSTRLEKSTAFPCPLALTATWNPALARAYARSIGEECRAGDIAVLLGPGMNIYRISQNGRNFEYFGEDPYLAARMIEQYVTGVQSTGTIATMKHFLCNNSEHQRRKTNSIVDERTLHEIYLPAFKAGVDAGAMAVMTSYNQLNGEYAGQSEYVIDHLLRKDLGFRWLVMSDWWSTWDPVKTIKSGMDLEMPGHPGSQPIFKTLGDIYVKASAARLMKEGKVSEADINRMAKSIIRTTIAMGLYDRPVKDESYLEKFPAHEQTALHTASESIVLLRNQNGILPLDPARAKKILLTGAYVDTIARGRGSAEVIGYNTVTMLEALTKEFGSALVYIKAPTDAEIASADVILLSVGTTDREGSDRPFALPEEMEKRILKTAAKNPNVIVIVNSGGGIQMTNWNEKVAAILYSWYPGQNGNTALAGIISGKINPSGKLPITIEKKFEDSPGYPYLPPGGILSARRDDMDPSVPIHDIKYTEGVSVGYRWYESKKIEPLYRFGFGLSYTTFGYRDLKVSTTKLTKGKDCIVEFTLINTGKQAGMEVAQLYVQDVASSVPRPVKELKGFQKIALAGGAETTVRFTLTERDLSFWDTNSHRWLAEPGEFNVMVGASSDDVRLQTTITLE